MRFKGQYSKIAGDVVDNYFRTIDADTLHEADKIAKRYERKGYRLISLKEDSLWAA